MNIQSFELGWNISQSGPLGAYDYPEHQRFFGAVEAEHPDLEIPGTADHPQICDGFPLSIETHPELLERVYVRFCDLEHGMSDLNEPQQVGELVRQFVHRFDPEATVTWGVIETER